MLIDSHVHLFPPEIRVDPVRYSAKDSQFAMLYGSGASMSGTAELITEMDRQGVDAAVAYGFPWQDTDVSTRHNDYLIDAAQRNEGRIIPAACVHPLSEGALREAERALDSGAVAIGEIGVYDRDFDDEIIGALKDLASLCRERGVPICLHTNEPIGHMYPGKAPMTLRGLERLLQAVKGTKIILAHFGGGIFFYATLKKKVAKVLADVYFDTAAAPYLYKNVVYSLALQIVGSEKLLLGTDYPLLKWNRYIKDLDEAGVRGKDRLALTGVNSAWVFGFHGYTGSFVLPESGESGTGGVSEVET